MDKRFRKTGRFLPIFIIGYLLFSGWNQPPHTAHAQSSDDPWSPAENLSNSGGTTNPVIVIDGDNIRHVIWDDSFDGTVYSSSDGNQWSEPLALSFPFSSSIPGLQPGVQSSAANAPLFVIDRTENIHAFWTDATDQLFHSNVASINFGNPGSWSPAVQLAESAIDFDVIADAQGILHAAYVRTLDTPDFPAGIYYRSSPDGGLSWGIPSLIYSSMYYRSLTRTEANVDIEVKHDSGGVELYLTWDNRPRKQVLFTYSPDGGSSWEPHQMIDSPTEDVPASNPVNIKVTDYEGGLLLIWQNGDPSVSCSQYYQYSLDEGSSWSERQDMLEGFFGCPQDQYFFEHNNLLLLMTNIQGQIYILAWDGTEWSLPQAQRALSGFEDPTTFNRVVFDCRRPGVDQDGNLLVVGCDTGGGGDIWLTARPLGDASEWFPPPSSWSSIERITQSDTLISSPEMLRDSQDRLHVFWIQQDTEASLGTAGEAIYYSRLEDNQWTRPMAVLQSPSGITRQPSVAIDPSDNLYVVWSGGASGEIYFSRALAERANSPAEWVTAITLPMVQPVGSSPDIHVGDDGTINVLYAVPLNEERGIYLTQSSDSGFSWSEPVLVFDAVAAEWDMVDRPQLSVQGLDVYNALWSKQSLPGGIGSEGLYASRSIDGGMTWSEPYAIVERPESWSEMLVSADGSLHRAWIETGSSQIFQHQVSSDLGAGWELPTSVSAIGSVIGTPSLTSDPAGQLYLLQGVQDLNQQVSIQNWHWDGSRWLTDETLSLDDQEGIFIEGISSIMLQSGEYSVLYSGNSPDPVLDTDVFILDTAHRVVEVAIPTLETTPLPAAQVTATPDPLLTVSPTPTPTVSLATILPPDSEDQQPTSTNSMSGLVIAAVLAGLVALIIFAIGLIRLRAR